EHLQGRDQEVAQLEILVASELVLAGLDQLEGVELLPGLVQFLVDAHGDSLERKRNLAAFLAEPAAALPLALGFPQCGDQVLNHSLVLSVVRRPGHSNHDQAQDGKGNSAKSSDQGV